MPRSAVAVIGPLFLVLLMAPAAHSKPKLTHSISSCTSLDRPSVAERRAVRKLTVCADNMPCRHRAIQDLPRPLRRCYIRPNWDQKKHDKCLKQGRSRAYVETLAKKGRIHITQRLRTYCNASDKISFRLKRKGKQLILKEIFHAKTVTRCVCPFDISAVITGLGPGTYSLDIVFDNQYAKEKNQLHQVEVTVL